MRDNKSDYLRCKNGFVLAGMEDMVYKENTYQLEDGDLLYLYTDGVTEADNVNHELFGEERLLDCFINKGYASPEDIIKTVKESMDGFINGNSQFDDITMLCLKWKKV